jgi:hypothetical protein
MSKLDLLRDQSRTKNDWRRLMEDENGIEEKNQGVD